MTDLDQRRAELELATQAYELEAELEAAREVRFDQPERFVAAKQALEERRTYWRQIGEYLRSVQRQIDTAEVQISVPTAGAVVSAISPE